MKKNCMHDVCVYGDGNREGHLRRMKKSIFVFFLPIECFILAVKLPQSFLFVRGQSRLLAPHPPLSNVHVPTYKSTHCMCVYWLHNSLIFAFFSCVKIIESWQRFRWKSHQKDTHNSFSCLRVQLLLNPRKTRLFIAFSAATVRRIRFRATTVLNIIDSITYDIGREKN